MVAAKSSRVNRQYKKKYRIRNWREYERGLRSRGDVTICHSTLLLSALDRQMAENLFVHLRRAPSVLG